MHEYAALEYLSSSILNDSKAASEPNAADERLRRTVQSTDMNDQITVKIKAQISQPIM